MPIANLIDSIIVVGTFVLSQNNPDVADEIDHETFPKRIRTGNSVEMLILNLLAMRFYNFENAINSLDACFIPVLMTRSATSDGRTKWQFVLVSVNFRRGRRVAWTRLKSVELHDVRF